MARATAEIELSLKFSKKLEAANSVPDALAAYQEWLNEEMGARAEDARLLMSIGQKFTDATSRFAPACAGQDVFNWSAASADACLRFSNAVRCSSLGRTTSSMRFRFCARYVLCWLAFPMAPALGSTNSATV
jgi:hypothetical protein